MKTRSRRRHLDETVSVSSKSRTISNWASSRCTLAIVRGNFRGEMPAEDLLFDIEANFVGVEEIYLGTRRCGLRLRFLPR